MGALSFCRSGGIGIHKRLKISRPVGLRVRVPSPVPLHTEDRMLERLVTFAFKFAVGYVLGAAAIFCLFVGILLFIL